MKRFGVPRITRLTRVQEPKISTGDTIGNVYTCNGMATVNLRDISQCIHLYKV